MLSDISYIPIRIILQPIICHLTGKPALGSYLYSELKEYEDKAPLELIAVLRFKS